MPGKRLTQRDRTRIAAWLDRRLTYAEIARRLERPTSTISREVERNGGRAGYDARRAQATTEQRDRRRHRSTSAAPPRDEGGGRDPATVRAVEHRLAEILIGTGLPRMPARVLGCLSCADSGSTTAAELVERLRVSPASISAAVNYLHDQRMIRRERSPGERANRYVVDRDVWFHATLASAERTSRLALAAREAADTLGTSTPAGDRLVTMSRFLGVLGEDLIQRAEQWQLRVRSET